MRNRNGEFSIKDKNKKSVQDKAKNILHVIYMLAVKTMENGLHLKRW